MSAEDMINRLGYDPGDPRNDLTKGFGSGVPTQRAIGMIGNFLGNAAFPGLGMLTGAAASKIAQMIQNGMGREAVQRAIAAYQQGGGSSSGGGDSGGGGTGGGFHMPNFGNMFGGLPEGFTETNRFGGGAPIFTGPGATGPQWSPGGSIFGGTLSPTGWVAGGGSTGNLGGYGGGLAPGMANLYLHGTGMQNWVQNQGYQNVGDWLRRTGFSLQAGGGAGSGEGIAGSGRPMTQSR